MYSPSRIIYGIHNQGFWRIYMYDSEIDITVSTLFKLEEFPERAFIHAENDSYYK